MRIYLYAILVLGLVFIGNYAGNIYGWYVTLEGYDVFMHIIGGFGIGLFAVALLESRGLVITQNKKLVVAAVLVAGLIWELFETYYGIAGAPVGTKLYYIDTVKDLFNDCLGAWVVAVVTER